MIINPAPLVAAVGAINWDITLFVDSLPAPGQEVAVTNVARVPGGTAANVAVAASRLLADGRVAFVGALGDDDIAIQQREILKAEGVITDCLVTIPGAESGQAYILVDSDGQNVIASALGANALLSAEHIREPGAREMIVNSRACALTDPPLPVIEEILNLTRGTDCRVSWDPGVLVTDREAVLPLASRVDVLLLNQDETRSLFGEDSPRVIGQRLRERDWTNQVILKRGGEGAVALDLAEGRAIHVPPLPLTQFNLHPISSVGAGDAFHGAFAALHAEGWDNREALRGAAAAAAITVSRPGTRAAPTFVELTQILDAWRGMDDAITEDTL